MFLFTTLRGVLFPVEEAIVAADEAGRRRRVLVSMGMCNGAKGYGATAFNGFLLSRRRRLRGKSG